MAGPRVVIIGAGIVGTALADELTMRGWTDVTVVEQGRLWAAGGSTSHAPGMFFQTNASRTMTAFAQYTVAKFAGLTLDGRWCFRHIGSIEVARTPARLTDLHRRHEWATAWGLESRLLDPGQVKRRFPLIDPDTILGGYHVPSDGITVGTRVNEAQGRRAIDRGARFVDGTAVTGIRTSRGRVTAVETEAGELACDLVVCAGGFWGPRIGALVGVAIPLQPLAHTLAKSATLPELARFAIDTDDEAIHPIIRDQDVDMYYRELVDRIWFGSYGHEPQPVSPWEIRSHAEAAPEMPSVLPFTADLFEPSRRHAGELIPALRDAELAEGFNGIFSFTPDGFPLVGESPDARGFWVAEAVWFTHSAGVSRELAEWLVTGAPSLDLHECDLNRFERHELTADYVRTRGIQNYVEVYDVIHPLQPMEDPRPLRTSPFHVREQALGACFLEAAGWERPQWYEVNAPLLERYSPDVPGRGEWASRHWSPISGAEALATRDAVALYDITTLKRLLVDGPGALAFLDGLTTNRLDRPIGSVVYTLLLNPAGGIVSDLTIARLAEDRFQVGANGPIDLAWLRRHALDDGTVRIEDVSAGTCALGLWGPRARDVIAPLVHADVSNAAHPYLTALSTEIGFVPVTMLRLSYVGELGWEIYAGADMGLKLWDTIWEAGRAHGLVAAGRAAFTSLRLEKGYRSYGADMTSEHDPWEAGLAFAVKLDKGDFVGRDALLRRRAEGPRRRLVPLVLDDREAVVMGREPVLVGGRPVGYVTSAAFGFRVGRSIAYAWLPAEAATAGRRVEIRYFGSSLGASVAEEPLYDPGMARLKA